MKKPVVPAERSSQLSHEKLLRSDLTRTSRLSGVLFVESSRLGTSEMYLVEVSYEPDYNTGECQLQPLFSNFFTKISFSVDIFNSAVKL